MLVVSKNESNCLLENKMVSTMSDYCMLFSQTFYGLLFSYLTIIDVTSYVHHKFPVSFVLYIATKISNQIMTVNSSANAPFTQKLTLARFACLCLWKGVRDLDDNYVRFNGFLGNVSYSFEKRYRHFRSKDLLKRIFLV